MEPTVLSENKPHLRHAEHQSISWQTRFFNYLSIIAYILLTADSAYGARRDPSALAFILFCFSDSAMLFFCLRWFERLGPDSQPTKEKEGLKAVCWVLATALNLAFAWRVAEFMPPALAVGVWLMAGYVAIGGFYLLFVYCNADGNILGKACCVVQNRELSPEEKV